LGVHSWPAIVTASSRTPGRGHGGAQSSTATTANGWSCPLAAGVRRASANAQQDLFHET
jgi:hypothetical protein